VTPQASLRSYQVAGGKTVQLPISAGARSSETANIKIEVTVEDATGSTAVTLVEDSNRSFHTAGYWKGESTPRQAGDSSLAPAPGRRLVAGLAVCRQ
jgi:hypothetical protein